MSSLSRNAHLYLRVMLMRRQVLLRVMAVKIALGAVAALFLLAGLALANVALFFWLAPRVGEPGAAAILAGAQILIGAIVLAVALRHAATSELEMLRETEEVTLALLTEEAEAITGLFAPVARSADRLGRNVALGLDIATTLLGFLRKK